MELSEQAVGRTQLLQKNKKSLEIFYRFLSSAHIAFFRRLMLYNFPVSYHVGLHRVTQGRIGAIDVLNQTFI
jgi:hypothetical protein